MTETTTGLAGRIALVTGAGAGIGRAIAHRLARAGADVAVNDISAPAAETVARELIESGLQGRPAAFDVTDSGAVEAAVAALVAETGRLDILVNNAGIGNGYKPGQLDHVVDVTRRRQAGADLDSLHITVATTDAEFDRVVKVILYGTFNCTRAVLRHMEAARSGAIVNIASTAGLMAAPLAPEYGAAKAAVASYTKSVAHEVAGAGVRVNAVAPGTIDTALNDRFGPLRAGLGTRHASGRMGRPNEIAEAVLWLASDAASYCFGEILTVSGGL